MDFLNYSSPDVIHHDNPNLLAEFHFFQPNFRNFSKLLQEVLAEKLKDTYFLLEICPKIFQFFDLQREKVHRKISFSAAYTPV